ncbi:MULTISPECIES: hypothetical protein [unclassified Streptomyces]|uniref:hypothetical protein n=1 Tax=unclassified Streptomyces TaxID=2593676 RepID=UPI001F08699C|nr:hypothetical protein [Streptomyces sp. CB09001]
MASAPIDIPRVGPVGSPDAALAALASVTPCPETRTLDDTAALRSEREVPADAAQGVDVAHRRVEYFVPVPDSAPEVIAAAMEALDDFARTLRLPGTD